MTLAADMALIAADTQILHDIANNDASATVMTESGAVDTVARAIGKIGGNYRGAWSGPGTAYIANDTVTESAALHRCITGHTSGATFAGDSSKWVVQSAEPVNVTNAQMADMEQATIKGRASGAGTGKPVDLTPAQTRAAIGPFDDAIITATGGSSARTLSEIAADTVCVLDYTGVDPTGATDSTSGILQAIGTGNRTVEFPPGTYLIGDGTSGDGINILYSDVNLVFARGATIKVNSNSAGITLARAASTTINRIGIYGLRMIAADTSTATTGIRIAPDATNAAHYVTIDDFIIDGMGQYGIVIASLSGGANHLTITNGRILNNGSLSGTHGKNALILNPSIGSASKKLTIANVYVEQVNDVAGTDETDACKIQNFTGVSISNYTCYGGGGVAVTGNTLILDGCTDLVAVNLRVVCNNGGGLQISNSATGVHEITNVTITGNIAGNAALIFATNGSNKVSLRGVHTAGAAIVSAGSTHDRLEITDSVIDGGIVLDGATVSNAVIKNNTLRGQGVYIEGNSAIIRGNIIVSASGYAVRVKGNAGFVDGNYAFSPVSGHVQVVSGTGNLVGTLHGDTTLVDGGTATKRSIASVPLVGGIGTYTAADTTPDVTGVNYMVIANAGAVTITDFDGGVVGQVLVLKFSDGNTTINRSVCTLGGSANFVSSADDTLVLVKVPGSWTEISRSVNG